MFPNSLPTNIFKDDNPNRNSMFPINQMMNSVIGGLPNPITDGLMPYGGGSMFGNFSSIVSHMNIQTNMMIGGINPGQSFNSATLISYSSNGPNGQPQVYKASTSTVTGPGGIKETKKAVSDSRTGVMKFAIGHHIGDRAHIVERQKNVYSGEQEETQEYINLDDDKLEDFNNEWRTKVQTMNSYRNHYSPYNHRVRKSTKPFKKHLKVLPSSTSRTSDVKKQQKQGKKRSVEQRKPKKLISDKLAIGDSKNKEENVQSSSESLK